MSFRIYLSSISTICKFVHFIRMRYKLCYRGKGVKESYWDKRTESSKTTAKTFYAELAWRYQSSWSSGIGSGPRVAAMAAQVLADRGHTHQLIACKIKRACAYLGCSHHLNWEPFPSPYSNVMRTQTQGTAAVASMRYNSDTQCHVKLILCTVYEHSGKLKVKKIWLYGACFGSRTP